MRTTDSEAVFESAVGRSVAVHSAGRTLLGVAGFCLLTALAAQVRIPVLGTVVPMTLQLLAVLLAGLMLRPGPAAGAMLAYLALGTLGLPVFCAGSLGVMGPTGGYIVGFVGAAWLVSVFRGDESAGAARLLVAGAIGLIVVFAIGVGWQVVWFGGDLRLAVATGFLPFVMKALVELLLAVGVCLKLRGRRNRRRAVSGI